MQVSYCFSIHGMEEIVIDSNVMVVGGDGINNPKYVRNRDKCRSSME